jgi:hypothetical protein
VILDKFGSSTVNWESVLISILTNVHVIDIHPLPAERNFS